MFGFIVGGVYTVLLLLRKIIRHNKVLLVIEDFSYVISIEVMFIRFIRQYNEGLIRWYMIFAMMFGICLIQIVESILHKILKMGKKGTK